LRALFRVPVWTELRNFGTQPIFKMSYFGVVAIPVLVSFVSSNPLGFEFLKEVSIPLNLKITFFVSFFLSLALITFIVGCPKEYVEKKVDLNASKNLNLILTNADRAVVNVAQDDSEFFVLLNGVGLLHCTAFSVSALGLAFLTQISFLLIPTKITFSLMIAFTEMTSSSS
jgi:hypothetical protein